MTDADGADWPPIRPAVAGGEPTPQPPTLVYRGCKLCGEPCGDYAYCPGHRGLAGADHQRPPLDQQTPEERAYYEAWDAWAAADESDRLALWRAMNDALSVVRLSSAARAVAGGEPTPYRQGVDRHPMFRDNEHVTATDSRCAIEHVPGRICMCDRDHDATEAAGGEPTRPSEQEWLQALLAAYDDWYGGRDWPGRFAPLIERERAAARREVVAAVEAVPYPTGFVTAGGAVEQFRADILRAARSATGEPLREEPDERVCTCGHPECGAC